MCKTMVQMSGELCNAVNFAAKYKWRRFNALKTHILLILLFKYNAVNFVIISFQCNFVSEQSHTQPSS